MSIQPSTKQQRSVSYGFSLIELMVVVTIMAILAAVAMSIYQGYVVRTNRSAATACMSQYANYMERFYTTNLRYDESFPSSSSTADPVANPVSGATPTLTLDCAGTSQTGNNYAVTVPAVAATTYTIQAKPVGVQATRDSTCGTLTLNQIGTRTANSLSTSTILAQCWGG
jgi:type IV pilus assembly protein PilE